MKTIIVAVLLLISSLISAQNEIAVYFSQDARLAVIGDDKGNDPFTPNFQVGAEWRGKQIGGYYFFIAPEYEQANLKGGIYRRYSANVGWTFNKWIERTNWTAILGYGIIEYNIIYRGFNLDFQFGYEIIDWLEIYLDAQILDRGDLQIYGDSFFNRIRFSGGIGIKINVFNT